MASIEHHRHQTIQLAIKPPFEAMLNASIDLWQRLASTLNLTIGNVGFQTLFSRSVHTTRKTFPWMMPGCAFHAAKSQFIGLRTCLEGQGITESSAASASLLNTFIDLLILLLGEQLTTSILRSAWSDRRSDPLTP